MNDYVGFLIESFNVEQNYILVRPYLDTFAKPSSAYPCVNITLTNLDLSKNISEQIGQICAPNIRNIQLQEIGNIDSAIEEELNNLCTQHIVIPLSSLQPYTSTPYIAPLSSEIINFVV